MPFKTVYLHGMVRSADGRKMSKSLGNVIPLEDTIKEYGTDALRLGIIAGRSPGDSSAYAPTRILAGRNFCNKLWNIARFIENKIDDDQTGSDVSKPQTPADHWILNKLQRTSDSVSGHLLNYNFAEGYEELYHFVWDDLADWYIEASKYQEDNGILLQVFEATLIILHSFAPYVTEVIWQTLFVNKNTLLINQAWPTTASGDKNETDKFDEIKSIVSESRFIVNTLKIKDAKLHISKKDFEESADLITKLSRITTITDETEQPSGYRLSQTTRLAWLEIDDKSITSYQKTLKDREVGQKNVIAGLDKRLKNSDYVDKAPKEIIDQTRQQLAAAKLTLKTIEEEARRFSVTD
jgi:valyl-tRNA synthetase